MYQNEEDIYGDELDGDEDRNDGLNALVYTVSISIIVYFLEFAMGHWYQQRH